MARQSWLSDSDTPLIDEYATKLTSFVEAMADGKIETHELEGQEERLVGMMKTLEPKLDDEIHAQVTELLCEMTAYNLMQMLHTMNESRPKTTFQG